MSMLTQNERWMTKTGCCDRCLCSAINIVNGNQIYSKTNASERRSKYTSLLP